MSSIDIGQSFENGVTKVFDFLPQLLGAIVILIIGYIIAKVVGGIIRRLLQRVRFDRAMHSSVAGNYVSRIVDSPSRFTGNVVYWLIFLFFISMAATALQLPALDKIVNDIYSYIPRIVSAIIIFLVASAVSAGTAKFVQRVMGRTPTAQLISTIVPIVTLSIAAFMILNQLDIAKDIVNILFTAIVGAVALGMALAFGLGGRDVAKQLLQQAYDFGRDNASQAQADVKRAAANTKREADRLRNI
ncbi:MAG: CmpX protein [Candidatus Saccharibacteria bacterium]|nr:CmpX protein [Candidatus Saccharibacteria bacterium]